MAGSLAIRHDPIPVTRAFRQAVLLWPYLALYAFGATAMALTACGSDNNGGGTPVVDSGTQDEAHEGGVAPAYGAPVVDAKGNVTGGAIIKYGVFLNTIIQFAIIALAIFLVVKLMNRLIRKSADAPPAPAADVLLLQEIRDILKSQKSTP